MKRKLLIPKKHRLKLCRNDLLLGAAFFAAAVIVFLVFILVNHGKTGDSVQIYLDGTIYKSYSLQETQDIIIDTEKGHNTIRIEEGTVWMTEADCPDQYCISSGPVTKNGEVIVCLPHRLVIEVTAIRQQEEFDAIAE